MLISLKAKVLEADGQVLRQDSPKSSGQVRHFRLKRSYFYD